TVESGSSVHVVLQGWLPHSAATSPVPAYFFHSRQVFAAPGWRPYLTRQPTHSEFERGHNHSIRKRPVRCGRASLRRAFSPAESADLCRPLKLAGSEPSPQKRSERIQRA